MSFEWPRWCTGWHEKMIIDMIYQLDMHTALVDGCSVGVVDEHGVPIKKPWRFVCTSPRQAASLDALRCTHEADFKHPECVGSRTAKTAFYPSPLCRTILASLFGFHHHCPSVVCKPISAATAAKADGSSCKCQHRTNDSASYGKFEVSPGFALATHGVHCDHSLTADYNTAETDAEYIADECLNTADTDL